MATQLQRALGLGSGKEPVLRPSEKPASKKEARGDKKGDGKRDPFPNLPRRPIGVDKGT